MASNPDLSNSITMHPHPFHLHPNRSDLSRSRTHTPTQPNNAAKPGLSTAVEPSEPADEEHDPVSRHTTHGMNDLEEQRPPQYTRENDPYQLAAAYKNENEMDLITANSSRKRDGCGPVKFNKDSRTARKIRKFYESQNESIERMLKPVEDHLADAKEETGSDHLKFQIAVYGSFAANIVLAGVQIYGAVSSGSLSLFTTMADAVFDPMSNITLILSNRAVKRVDPNRFPSGKARLETGKLYLFRIRRKFILIRISWEYCFLFPHDSSIIHSHRLLHQRTRRWKPRIDQEFPPPFRNSRCRSFRYQTFPLSLLLGHKRQVFTSEYPLARSPQ